MHVYVSNIEVRVTLNAISDKDPCRPNPCGHGGFCTEIGGGFACNCTLGFKGSTCQGKTLNTQLIITHSQKPWLLKPGWKTVNLWNVYHQTGNNK